jgi:hypothetical protein
VAEKARWDLAKTGQELGLVWKTERKSAKLLLTSFAYFSVSYFIL